MKRVGHEHEIALHILLLFFQLERYKRINGNCVEKKSPNCAKPTKETAQSKVV